jgi:hypothetical protein
VFKKLRKYIESQPLRSVERRQPADIELDNRMKKKGKEHERSDRYAVSLLVTKETSRSDEFPQTLTPRSRTARRSRRRALPVSDLLASLGEEIGGGGWNLRLSGRSRTVPVSRSESSGNNKQIRRIGGASGRTSVRRGTHTDTRVARVCAPQS